jgi:hypothetical protein
MLRVCPWRLARPEVPNPDPLEGGPGIWKATQVAYINYFLHINQIA